MRVCGMAAVVLVMLALHQLPVLAELEDEAEVDMEALLDALRRTRPKPPPVGTSAAARAPFAAGAADKLAAVLRGTADRPRTDNAARLPEDGVAASSRPRSKPGPAGERGGGKGKFRKDSIDRDSLRTREQYQRTQADRVRTCYKEGKEQILLLGVGEQSPNRTWDVPCHLEFYQDAYGIVPGCTPSIARGGACSRAVVDSFGADDDMRDLAIATEAAMHNLFHQGGTTSLAPASSLDRLGAKGAILFQMYLAKVKLQIMKHFQLESLYDSGALLTRLKGEPPEDEWDMEPGHVYWNPHIDKANIPTYDYSALLYLNNKGRDFEGGDFAFLDDDADRIVEPRAGRLLYFTSGPENLHQVQEVRTGTRYVLAMWFTCSREHKYVDE